VTQLLAAEWVLPVVADPIRDGILAIEGARIAWVGSRRDLPSRFLRAPIRAYPRSLLLPGWVNAHCHLDLTAALGLLSGSAERFAEWQRSVDRLRAAWPPQVVRQSIVAGLDLLASTGTTTVAHVAKLPSLEPFIDHPMRSVVFHEASGFRAEAAGPRVREAEAWLEASHDRLSQTGLGRITLGLAPHAPYSASPQLLRGLARVAEAQRLPLSIHLAETPAEVEFLKTGARPLRGLLEEAGEGEPAWSAPGVSPVRYLADLGLLRRPGAAVHCNYLSEEDVELLAGGRLIPVWCPGSHRFFGHPEYPAARLRAAGCRVALGTESLAGNAGLSMLREVRLAAEAFPSVERSAWLRAGTLDAAVALGLGDTAGSLEPGKAADVQVLGEAADEITDPWDALFGAPLRVRSVRVEGVEMRIR
jgi:cytosine/adenosine deaminase-related metal-dependent hydrolase